MLHVKTRSGTAQMMVLEGGILLVPLVVLPFYPQEAHLAWQLLVPGAASVLLGLMPFAGRRKPTSSQLVVFAWLYGFVLAAIPFWLHGGLTPVQALFESVSGFTTTGLSVLDVEKTPHLFLFYRAFLQYVGGLGFVMMMLLFVQEKDSVSLYEAEGHPDRLMPNLGKTARVIALMYGFFLLVGTVLYLRFGMGLFDSLVHTMCALSTGGFSNRLDSIGAYHSLPIEWITVVLMLIGTTNFSLLLLLFKGKLRAFARASEMRFLLGLTVVAVPLMALCLVRCGYGLGQGLETAFFNAFSALSTTGYATCSYADWPGAALGIMILLMLVGGGIGSTAGGIKLGRVCRLLKHLVMEVRKKMLPDRAVVVAFYDRGTGREVLDDSEWEEAATYAHAYLLIYAVGTLLLTFVSGCTLTEGAFEFASALGTVGLSIGVTSMESSSLTLLIEIFAMILGRLEIFVLFQAVFKKRPGHC